MKKIGIGMCIGTMDWKLLVFPKYTLSLSSFDFLLFGKSFDFSLKLMWRF